MIAKLSVGSVPTNRKQEAALMAPANATAQSKRKRAKLIDMLLNTNWSKSSQQAANLVKLNKILLVCDANFIDEKTGESPISLAISSSQISETIHGNAADGTLANKKGHQHQQQNMLTGSYCPQSASLFSLQYQFSGTNGKLMLQKINTNEICHSDAPLIERMLLLLIKAGALIDFRNSDGRTPLHVAAMKSNFWALKILLDLGAVADYLDINGLTPLYYSILHKAELKVTQLLLNYTREPADQQQRLLSLVDADGLNPGVVKPSPQRSLGVTDQHGWQEVHQACKLGLDAHLDKLLYFGCDMNAKITGSGNTPLHVAAINDQLECVKVLLMRGADKTIINNSHQTAHQVAVIANNLELAEFIAKHNPDNIIPLRERPTSLHTPSAMTTRIDQNSIGRLSNQSSARSSLVNSQSSASIVSQQQRVAAIVQPQLDQRQIQRDSSINQSAGGSPNVKDMMNPLSCDVAHSSRLSTISSSGNSSGNGSQPQSLLSIGTCNNNGTDANQLNVQVTNISPCLSQRSCATSNTTSSSGVCCDADGLNNSGEESQQARLNNSLSQHSNVTIISIGNQSASTAQPSPPNKQTNDNKSAIQGGTQPNSEVARVSGQILTSFGSQERRIENSSENEDDQSGCQSSSSSTTSSINGLCSLISEERPLFAGTIVEAISDYQSGDPSHLQLHRGDLIEVLEFTPEQMQSGQWPHLANKPMVFGRRQSDSQRGLFPSFCVQRTKHQKSKLSTKICHRSPLANLTNGNSNSLVMSDVRRFSSGVQAELNKTSGTNQANSIHWTLRELGQNVRDKLTLPESQSMVALDSQLNRQLEQPSFQQSTMKRMQSHSKQQLRFKEIEVMLKKVNDGFGFVLRGARVDPTTLANSSKHFGDQQDNRLPIDENLMAANNLVSLQYLDEIEVDSVAHQAGLRRGDFLVAVNGVDVRFSSHEQVVQMIRQSGDQVHLKIASFSDLSMSGLTHSTKTLTKVKPEPPRRDPNTTLTRDRAQRAKANHENPQLVFDANKPLPNAPGAFDGLASPTGSLNHEMARSVSTNLAHFNSTQSLTCQSLANSTTDTLSITSTSTIGVDQQMAQSHQQSNHHPTPTLSSSSTATLTTVATMKPKAPPKPSSMLRDNNPGRDVCSSQKIYQPAVITTTKRGTQQSPIIADSPRITQEHPLPSSDSQSSQNNQYSSNLPTPPPPPPPLPDFQTDEINSNRFNQRRISAPVNRLEHPITADNNTLAKKRESLAVMGSSSNSIQQIIPEFGSVAAACAAAANSRLQRQQMEQNRKDNLDHEPDKEKAKQQSPPHQQKPEVGPKPQSLTLGRKSSAQIIQQPKQQSQTLKISKTKSRPEIPSYEELPAPPPPLPAISDEWRLDQESRVQSGHVRCQLHGTAHHNTTYQTGCSHQADTCTSANELSSRMSGKNSSGGVVNGMIDQRRIAHDVVIQQQQQQQQQLLMLHRQQMMRQQLRQQQLIQQHQQQLMLQQQMQVQSKEPLVVDSKSCVTAPRRAMPNESDHHNHHDNQRIAHYHGQHHHHHHHHHRNQTDDEPDTMYPTIGNSSTVNRTTAATRHQDQQNVNLNHQHLLQQQQQQQILMKMAASGVANNNLSSHGLYHSLHNHHHHHHLHQNSQHQYHHVHHNHPHSHQHNHVP